MAALHLLFNAVTVIFIAATMFAGGISLDVGALVRTVAVLQLVPFAIGLLLRHYTTDTAVAWHPATVKVSNVTFLIVLAGMLLGNWSAVVALLGSRALLAGFLFSALGFGFGTLLATGSPARR